MVKWMLTPCMKNWLEDKGADYGKIRKRVCSNTLLVNKIDSLIRGEMKSTYHLRQVVKGHGNSDRKRSSIAANNNYYMSEKRSKLNR